jgi:hypothetical protein
MMRWWRVVVCAVASVAHADADPLPIVQSAMPSGVHVARAETLDQGVAVVQVVSGLGYRRGLLGSDHSLVRALANVAGAYGITPTLTVGLSLDGYYDRHAGFPTGPSSGCGDTCEEGYVGAPHLSGRYVRRVGDVAVGAHAELWIPGDQMPSLKLGATSLELRGLVSLHVGPGLLSIDAGLRLDNTGKTTNDIVSLTVPDRVSYGSSDYHALVAGLHYAVIVSSRLWVAGESSVARFIGRPPAGRADLEDGRWLARLGGSVGYAFTPHWHAIAFIDAVKSPGVLDTQAMANEIPLIPYEPVLTTGLGVQARFGGGSASPSRADAQRRSCWDTPAGCESEEQPLVGAIAGTVLDDDGKPLGGATVTITGKATGVSAMATTSADGTYAITNIRLGKRTLTPTRIGPTSTDTLEETELEMRIEADGRDPVVSRITAPKPGQNAVPAVTLQPTLPSGQVKGIVRTRRGEPIANAVIDVVPGEATAISGVDGTFAIDLVPGTYKVTAKAPGYKAQQLQVTIDPNGVSLKEFILIR